MKGFYYFHRSDQKCLLAQNKSNDDWHGFVGFMTDHPFHGCGFKKIKNISIFKVPINDLLDTNSSIRKSLWYMGFCTHPYSREKTLEDLKQLADNIAEELQKDIE
ncbi:hypothetical protein LCGC14_1085520 [marine sediment metagenome]|uniref:Uncharacterized protein n=1 Tax=marine sediment metagenome TaxID=412755 RepID=A0A0F9PX31_9ZZZZ